MLVSSTQASNYMPVPFHKAVAAGSRPPDLQEERYKERGRGRGREIERERERENFEGQNERRRRRNSNNNESVKILLLIRKKSNLFAKRSPIRQRAPLWGACGPPENRLPTSDRHPVIIATRVICATRRRLRSSRSLSAMVGHDHSR